MRTVSVFYNGMFQDPTFRVPEHIVFKKDFKEDSDLYRTLKLSMSSEDFICDSIFVNNQNYRNNDLIVIGIEDSDNMSVGIIMTILVKNSKVYFVIKRYTAKRNWLQYFRSEQSSNVYEFIDCNRLVDFKPLIMRGTLQNFESTLHHHVSFDYT